MLRPFLTTTPFALLLGLVLVRPAAGERPAPGPARSIPAQGLVFYLEYDGLDAHADAWRQTASYALLNQTKAGAMIAELTEQVLDESLRNATGPKLNGFEAASLVEHVFRNGFAVAEYESAPPILILPGAGREVVRDRFDRFLRNYTRAAGNETHAPIVVRDRRILEAWSKEEDLLQNGNVTDAVPPPGVGPVEPLVFPPYTPARASSVPRVKLPTLDPMPLDLPDNVFALFDPAQADPETKRTGVTLPVIAPAMVEYSWWFEGEDLIIVLGTAFAQAEPILDAREGKRPSTATHPSYLATKSEPGVEGFVPSGLFFDERPKDWLQSYLPARPELIDENGHPRPHVLGLPMRIAGRWGFHQKALLLDFRVDGPAPHQGWSALYDQPGFSKNALPPLPSNLEGFIVLSLDLTKIADVPGGTAASAFPNVQPWVRWAQEAFQELTGLNLKDDLLAHLGTTWAIYELPSTHQPKPGKARSATPILMASVRDSAGLSKVLDICATRVNRMLGEAERDAGRVPAEPVVQIKPVDGPQRGFVLSSPSGLVPWIKGNLRPTVLVGHEFLDLALTTNAARRALAPEMQHGPPWAPAGEVAAVWSSLPERLTLLAIGDARSSAVPELFEKLPSMVQQVANVASDDDEDRLDRSDYLAAMGLRKPGGFQIRIDPTHLPKADELRPFLFPSVLAASVDDRGLRVVCREAVPLGGLGPRVSFQTSVDLKSEGNPQRKIMFGVGTFLNDDELADEPKDDVKKDDAARWTPLFNGRDLTGWYTFLQKHGKNSDPDRVITIEDETIHLYKNAKDGSDVVMGYIGTEKEYSNYHFRVQYRWGEKKFQPRYALKRDAGLYYHITGPDAVWPRSLQYQVEQTNVGDLIALYGMQLDTWIDPKTRDDKVVRFLDPSQGGEARVLGGKGIAYQGHLAGEFEVEGWNTAEIIAKGDTTTHLLNGHVVNRGTKIRFVDPDKPGEAKPLTRGRIALEIEAAEMFFRNVEIRSLDDTP